MTDRVSLMYFGETRIGGPFFGTTIQCYVSMEIKPDGTILVNWSEPNRWENVAPEGTFLPLVFTSMREAVQQVSNLKSYIESRYHMVLEEV